MSGIDLTNWPQVSDVQAQLMSADLWPKTAMLQQLAQGQIAIAIPTAVAEWSRVTSYNPFLNNSNAVTTRNYVLSGYGLGSPNQIGQNLFGVWLDTGLLTEPGIPAPIVQTTNGQSTITLTYGQQYWFRPTNAQQRNKPWTSIALGSPGAWFNGGSPQYLTVTGCFGYCNILPIDVWNAVRVRAAALAFQDTARATQGQTVSTTLDGAGEKFDIGILRNDRVDYWNDVWNKTMRNYIFVRGNTPSI